MFSYSISWISCILLWVPPPLVATLLMLESMGSTEALYCAYTHARTHTRAHMYTHNTRTPSLKHTYLKKMYGRTKERGLAWYTMHNLHNYNRFLKTFCMLNFNKYQNGLDNELSRHAALICCIILCYIVTIYVCHQIYLMVALCRWKVIEFTQKWWFYQWTVSCDEACILCVRCVRACTLGWVWERDTVLCSRMFKYKSQNYWVFGLCLSSGILKTREHNVLETRSVSVLRWGGETCSVGSFRKS
jgi:hypothetical protein